MATEKRRQPLKKNAETTPERVSFRPGNMLYPVPAVMVTCGDYAGASNIITIAWTGTVCSDPPMLSISVRPERYSYDIIRESGEFAVNLVTEDLARAMDYCGVRSGRDHDKWTDCGLTKFPGETVRCPLIAESPVNLECRVATETPLGSHHLFLAEITAVRVDGRYLDDRGAFDLHAAHLMVYSHGTYYALGRKLGTFGYSVKKPSNRAGHTKKKTAR